MTMNKVPQFRPIVFISHSARTDPDAYPVLKVIEAYLKKNGFDVFVDETRIEGGEPWRNCLHTWMGHCHGAIVLLTKKALSSRWTLKEATILSWRQSLSGGKFPLLPVFLGLSSGDLAKSEEFSPLNLNEIEALKNLNGAKLCRALVKHLAPLRTLEARTPQREMEEKIAEWLSQVSRPALLNKVADNLGEDLGGWNPKRDLPSKVAMLLLQAPFEKLVDGLDPLVGAIPGESLRLIVEMLQGSWVDRELAGGLALVARKAQGTRVAALNASQQEFTTKAIIARAKGGYPPWLFVCLSSAAGEDLVGSLKAQVRAAFEKLLVTKNPGIIDLFMQKREKREPMVIVLPPPETEQSLPDDADVEALLRAYPLCTLLVMTGASLPPDNKLTNVQRLRPHLRPREEDEAYTSFVDLETHTSPRTM